MRRLALLLAFALATGLAWYFWPASATSRAGWMEDYERLKQHTARAYANLADRLARGRVDPRALDERTRAALVEARSLRQARRALEAFAAAFEDAHFNLSAPYGRARMLLRRILGKDRGRGQGPITHSTVGTDACRRMGYREPRPGEVAWASLPGYRSLGGGDAARPFPAGVLPVESGRAPLAVLRIGLFSSHGYPALCAAVWDDLRPTGTEECDPRCQRAFSLEVDFALADRLAAQLAEIERAGARTLLVDITGNGGGSSVVDPLARTLTPIPLRAPALGFIRHPHWVRKFENDAKAFAADLARTDITVEQRAILATARAEAERRQREAETPCDLPGIWEKDRPTLPCRPTGRTEGYLDYAPPGALDGLESKGRLFGPSQYRYREGAWKGGLLVLTDGRTASASEQFAALLRDNGAATLLGAPTMGIGCGYTNGGVVLELPHTGLTVRAPDCIRYRRDGRNEADGVAPDVPVPWQSGDDGRARAAKVLAALPPS